MLSVKSVYQYPDTQTGDEDAFAREPFVVWFSSPKTGEKREPYLHKNDEMMTIFSSLSPEIKDFVIIPIHTSPEAAVKEIDELYDVYQNVSQLWRSDVRRFSANRTCSKTFNNAH